MTRNELINRVKSNLDEISPSGSLIVDVGVEDNNPLDEIINNLLDESAKEVLIKAPVIRLNATKATETATQDPRDSKIGTIDIPEDFLRIVELKMADWYRSVTEIHAQGTPIANMQYNKYTRAGVVKPIAVLSHRENKTVIEYYSVNTSHAIDRFMYIKKESAENIPEILQDALCWICASRVLFATGSSVEKVKLAENNAISLMM